jgi:hypothetical protein
MSNMLPDYTPTYPPLPPGPLAEAFTKLDTVYVETRFHRDAQQSLRLLFTAAGDTGGHKGLAVIGPSGSGKTAAVREVGRWLCEAVGLASDANPVPIRMLSTKSTPRGLGMQILSAGADPLAERTSLDLVEQRLFAVGRNLRFHGLALDEFHHAFRAKNPKSLSHMTTLLKNVVNAIPRPIIVMGTSDLGEHLNASDELSQRFQERVYLEDPVINRSEDIDDVFALLESFERIVPCDPTLRLVSPELLVRLLVGSDNRFGLLVGLLKRACKQAASDKQPRLRMQDFALVWRASAPPKSKSDEVNPFVQPLDVVKVRAKQTGAAVLQRLHGKGA